MRQGEERGREGRRQGEERGGGGGEAWRVEVETEEIGLDEKKEAG